jgi:hypothetical protein
MTLAKQLSAIKNQDHDAGWSLLDKGDDAVFILPTSDGGLFQVQVPKHELAGTRNRFGEPLPFGVHRSGAWTLREEAGHKVLCLFRFKSDVRPGSQFYVVAPALLSPERIAGLRFGLSIQVYDGAARISYSIQDGEVCECVEGNDRGEYREAAEAFLKKASQSPR